MKNGLVIYTTRYKTCRSGQQNTTFYQCESQIPPNSFPAYMWLIKILIIIQLEDFSRPKIIWKRIGSILRFSFDNKGCLGLDSTCFAAGEHIEYLCCVLNSLMGHYLLKDSPKTGTGDLLVSVQAIEPARIPYNAQYDRQLSSLLSIQTAYPSNAIEKEINDIVFTMYGLSPNEREYVTQYVKLSQQSL